MIGESCSETECDMEERLREIGPELTRDRITVDTIAKLEKLAKMRDGSGPMGALIEIITNETYSFTNPDGKLIIHGRGVDSRLVDVKLAALNSIASLNPETTPQELIELYGSHFGEFELFHSEEGYGIRRESC